MKLRTQFILTLLFFGLILSGMVGSLILTNQQVDRVLQQEEIARRIEQGASELNYLSGDYLMYGESQQRARWESSFTSFSADLASLKPANLEQQAIINHIVANQKRLRAIFTDVVSTMKESAQTSVLAPDPAFIQVSWSRMEVQNQSMAFEAAMLSQQLRDEADRLKRMNIMLMFFLFGIFGAYLLTNHYLINRRTLRSIAELQTGTEIIGSGNLDFTIAVKQADEIGELSREFNQMTANLKEVTASKTDLEREIAERELAEEQLERSNQKLNEIIVSIQDDFYVLNRDWNFVYASRLFTSKVGKEPEDFVGNNIWKMFPNHLGTVLEENFRAAMEKREIRRFEIGGKYTAAWYRMTAFPSAEGITILGTDITEGRRAEEALQAQALELEMQAEELRVQKNELIVANEHLRFSEELANQRLMETQSANKELQSARRAALNLMEDALAAQEALRAAHNELELRVQERTEELAIKNKELLNEIAERKGVERQLRIRSTAMGAAANGIVITDPQGTVEWTNPALAHISGYEAHELIGQNMRIFKSGQHAGNYYSNMWETILLGEVWRGETVNCRKDGTLYTEEQTITPVRGDQGQITHFIAIKQDITERKQAEEKLEQQNAELQIISTAERNQRQFSEALIKAALVLNRSLKLDDVLPLILEQIRDVIPYQLADVTLLEGETFYDASHQGDFGWPANLMDVNNRFLVESFPLFNKMRETGEPVLVLDTRKEQDWITIDSLVWVRSFLSVPLLVENRVIGFVNLFGDQPGFFTQQMSDRLVAFAAHAAVAIQNAWLFEQVQASTERLQSLSRRLVEIQENERKYIARELHDEAGQVLTALLVDLRLLEKNASQPDSILKIVAEMERSLNGVIENLHRMAMALRPASLDHVGLVAALRQHVETVGEKHGLKASFRSSGVIERLPANVETILYRTVQEALTNVVRHAQATRVDVVLTVRDQKLVVLVEDDGVGFDPGVVPTDGHLGLFGIRERSEMIGATLMVESEPGKGTTIMMEVAYANTVTGRR